MVKLWRKNYIFKVNSFLVVSILRRRKSDSKTRKTNLYNFYGKQLFCFHHQLHDTSNGSHHNPLCISAEKITLYEMSSEKSQTWQQNCSFVLYGNILLQCLHHFKNLFRDKIYKRKKKIKLKVQNISSNEIFHKVQLFFFDFYSCLFHDTSNDSLQKSTSPILESKMQQSKKKIR